jgi:hypothetical protein
LFIPCCLVWAACSGGGGGVAADPQVSAVVPGGTGQVAIQMTGTWEIRDAAVVDSTLAPPLLPLNGTTVVLDGAKVVSIAGLSVARADLEAFLGTPLTLYVNQADGRKLFYGIATDRFATGGTRDKTGLAGGSVNDVTIATEAYTGTLADAASTELFTRSRYTLAKIGVAAPLGLAPDAGTAEQQQRLRAALQALSGLR